MTRITATEAARNFSDVLNRVQYRDEKFEIWRGRQVVATLMQPETKPRPIGEFLRWLARNRHLDESDAADFETLIDELRREQPQADPEWDPIVDTNVLIRAERGVWGHGLKRLMDSEEEGAIAAISLSELMLGVHLADSSDRAERRASFIESLLTWLVVIPFARHTAERHALLRASLRRKGLTVGPHDLLIAATAAAMDWRVLTHNVAEFSFIDGLAVEAA